MSSWIRRYLQQPVGQARTPREHAHRPWPLPRGSWLMGQTWLYLLFAHWRVDAQLLREHVPAALPIDEFDGSAWLGVTPFQIESLRLRRAAPLPLASNFPELNVRTYVTVDDRPGVFFLRLDTPSVLAVAAARAAYRLPYARAAVGLEVQRGGDDEWRAQVRASRGEGTLAADYAAVGPVFTADPGTLEHFLTERYRLYTTDDAGAVRHAEIHHPPWPLQHANCSIELDRYLPTGIAVAGDPLAHVAARQDVVIWPLSGAAGD